MLYATFAEPNDVLAGIAIYDDGAMYDDGTPSKHNNARSQGPLVVMDYEEMSRIILEMQSLRDQRDVHIRRAKLTLVPDIMDMATARDEMPTTMEEYRIMADKEANDE
jgi:hypothetical protein